jgi:hypothetical protein
LDAWLQVSQDILDSTHSDPDFTNTIITGDESLGARVQVSQDMLNSTHIDSHLMNAVITVEMFWMYGYKSLRTCWTPHTVILTSLTP